MPRRSSNDGRQGHDGDDAATPPVAYDWAQFYGIYAPTYTQVPDVVLDFLVPLLSEGEVRCLLYICRRTFGFSKKADAISIDQMVHGITKEDGSRLDYGTGLSRSAVMRGLRGLREKRIVLAQQQASTTYGQAPTVYSLNLLEPPAWMSGSGDPRAASGTPPSQQWHAPVSPVALPRTASDTAPVSTAAWPPSRQRTPQETVVQNRGNKKQTPPKPPLRGGATQAPRRVRQRDAVLQGPERFTSGSYGVCPVCLSNPCDVGCPGPGGSREEK